MPENTRAVLYRRVSTNDQSLGLAAQLEALEAVADQRGWTYERVTDEGVSGSVPAEDRPELGPALDTLGPDDVLAVAKLDRLSRSVLDFAAILKRAEEGGWSIVVLDLGVDMTRPNGKLIAHVLIAMAEWERETISTRIREGLAQSNKRLGRKPGLPPVKKTKPAPIPPEVAAVVWDASAEGLSPRAIAERLNSYGLASPRGKRWHRESVRRLLARIDA